MTSWEAVERVLRNLNDPIRTASANGLTSISPRSLSSDRQAIQRPSGEKAMAD